MRDYIKNFCTEFGYPDEATEVIVNAYDRISSENKAAALLSEQIEIYNKGSVDHNAALKAVSEAASLVEVHPYTAQLLLYICLSKRIRELYKERNILYDIFYDSMSDLKWKLFECKKIYGIWGSFVAWWFNRFFDLTRFALGRLQFETIPFDRTYSKNGVTLNPGDIVLNVHIPSCGPLKHEDCIASYKKAAEFYKDTFKDKPVVFRCSSWLLFPKHTEFLPENSNILTFMSDYDIFESSIDEEKGFLWRIFYTMDTKDLDILPKESSLQRAYIDWLKKGNAIGSGTGIFAFIK